MAWCCRPLRGRRNRRTPRCERRPRAQRTLLAMIARREAARASTRRPLPMPALDSLLDALLDEPLLDLRARFEAPRGCAAAEASTSGSSACRTSTGAPLGSSPDIARCSPWPAPTPWADVRLPTGRTRRGLAPERAARKAISSSRRGGRFRCDPQHPVPERLHAVASRAPKRSWRRVPLLPLRAREERPARAARGPPRAAPPSSCSTRCNCLACRRKRARSIAFGGPRDPRRASARPSPPRGRASGQGAVGSTSRAGRWIRSRPSHCTFSRRISGGSCQVMAPPVRRSLFGERSFGEQVRLTHRAAR